MSDQKSLADWSSWADTGWMDFSYNDQAKLLARLRKAVQIVSGSNGMERFERYALPNEVEAGSIREAATILYFGELEAAVEGPPASASEKWSETVRDARKSLEIELSKPEVTDGDAEYSRQSHATKALDMIRRIEQVALWSGLSQERDPDPEELTELLAEVADFAFNAGRHMQVVWGKPFEKDALAERRQAAHRSTGGKNKSLLDDPARAARFARMDALVDEYGVDEAAKRVAKALKGKVGEGSWNTIKGQWNKFLREGKIIR